jgi:hypothetical protein
MVIVPVNGDVYKAKNVTEECRKYTCQVTEFITMRGFNFQHHDGDENGNHAVTECFKPGLSHF